MAEPAMKQPYTPSMTCTKIPNGYRVHSAKEAAKFYEVTVVDDTIVCTCTDYVRHKRDKNYQCRHIVFALEVFKQDQGNNDGDDENGYEESFGHKSQIGTHNEISSVQVRETEKRTSSHMCIKRSISPDNRINCISIKINFDLADQTTSEIKAKAAYALKLQQEIAAEYLLEHQEVLSYPPTSPPNPSTPPTGTEPTLVPTEPLATPPVITQSANPVPAKLVSIGTLNGKWGIRYFLTVDLEGKAMKLFGNQKQLSEKIHAAGYFVPAEQIRGGVSLNIPCRVTTQPSADGRYLNVENVYPA